MGSEEALGGLGAKLPAAGHFLGKTSCFIAIRSQSHMFKTILKYYIFNILKPIEKIKLFNSPFTYNVSPKLP